MKPAEPELYKPAEACRIAEVAPYVLRYWETEFPALADGREKGSASRLYTGRDVQVIRRIRELLYDEGFTVAGAKKRLEAEISEGRFDEGLESAPSPATQKKGSRTTGTTSSAAAASVEIPPTPVVESGETAFLSDIPLQPQAASSSSAPSSGRASKTVSAAPEFADRKRVVRELKDLVKILDRSSAARRTR